MHAFWNTWCGRGQSSSRLRSGTKVIYIYIYEQNKINANMWEKKLTHKLAT